MHRDFGTKVPCSDNAKFPFVVESKQYSLIAGAIIDLFTLPLFLKHQALLTSASQKIYVISHYFLVTAVEGTELSGTISEGALTTKAGSTVSADITDTEITATGGEIPGTISGTSSVEVKDGGPTTLSRDNSYTF